MGIEPTSEAWEASILPLNYARSAKAILLASPSASRAILLPSCDCRNNSLNDSGMRPRLAGVLPRVAQHLAANITLAATSSSEYYTP